MLGVVVRPSSRSATREPGMRVRKGSAYPRRNRNQASFYRADAHVLFTVCPALSQALYKCERSKVSRQLLGDKYSFHHVLQMGKLRHTELMNLARSVQL